MNQAITLFLEFFKIGLFAIGGGPATIPFLMDLTKKYDWFTMQELTNMIAISESTPGPVGLNMATYVGVTTMGIKGGLIATVGLVTPSIIVILIIAKFLENFSENRFVKATFYGIRPAVAGLIATAVYGICKVSLFQITETNQYIPQVGTIVLAALVFALMQIPKLKKMHPGLWILAAAMIGVVLRL